MFWRERGLPVTGVFSKAILVPSRTLRERGLRFTFEAFESPFLALILWWQRELLA